MLPCAPAFFRASMRAYECANGRASYSSGRTARVCGRSLCQLLPASRAGLQPQKSPTSQTVLMETLKKEMQERLADLCQGLDQACTLAGDTASSMHALQEENATLKTTMQEAEKAIDELMAVVDKEKKKAAENLKSFTDMKSYANELELAFNDLHGRHAKLKEYYTASDSNNQV